MSTMYGDKDNKKYKFETKKFIKRPFAIVIRDWNKCGFFLGGGGLVY